MKLGQAEFDRLDSNLEMWGRWRRSELEEVCPRNPLKGASWQRQITDSEEWDEIAHRIEREPDEEVCTRIQLAYERVKEIEPGFEQVIRDVYVERNAHPPRRLLNYCVYLMWRHGA